MILLKVPTLYWRPAADQKARSKSALPMEWLLSEPWIKKNICSLHVSIGRECYVRY